MIHIVFRGAHNVSLILALAHDRRMNFLVKKSSRTKLVREKQRIETEYVGTTKRISKTIKKQSFTGMKKNRIQ